eukprot:CAMPEP_0182464924 /NCGR_PEP_ID=MMETSP1319-20130603/8904_1 /TAXON_ID=172717 /ORGANISM="Bolidomonas pacifica, Strain RCC208" /LENGTH=273 /DNA_ID=CAMNT_0024664597 /DNA_START=184 /DNA_END=1001 /DNA_ORIENTATION=+
MTTSHGVEAFAALHHFYSDDNLFSTVIVKKEASGSTISFPVPQSSVSSLPPLSSPNTLTYPATTPCHYSPNNPPLPLLSIYFQLLHPTKFINNFKACKEHGVENVKSADKPSVIDACKKGEGGRNRKKDKDKDDKKADKAAAKPSSKSSSSSKPQAKKAKPSYTATQIASALTSTSARASTSTSVSGATSLHPHLAVGPDAPTKEDVEGDRQEVDKVLKREQPVTTIATIMTSTDKDKNLNIALKYASGVLPPSSKSSSKASSSRKRKAAASS